MKIDLQNKIEVIHIKQIADLQNDSNNKFIYIGRYNSNILKYNYIENANLGNPFKLENQTEEARIDSINKFDEYLKNLKPTDRYYRNIVSLLNKIKNSNENDKFHLVCFCKPKLCHGDSLKDFMIELDKNWIWIELK